MARYWKPSKSQAQEYAIKMKEIDEFCKNNAISQSFKGDSYYFNLNDIEYRVSNHTIEASNRGAHSDLGKVRQEYHKNGREENVVYIHASKLRIIEIYNQLKAGKRLDGRGNII